MHQSKNCNKCYFGVKAHIGVYADAGLMHPVRGTAGNVSRRPRRVACCAGRKEFAFGDAGYRGVYKRPDVKARVRRHVAMRPACAERLTRNQRGG